MPVWLIQLDVRHGPREEILLPALLLVLHDMGPVFVCPLSQVGIIRHRSFLGDQYVPGRTIRFTACKVQSLPAICAPDLSCLAKGDGDVFERHTSHPTTKANTAEVYSHVRMSEPEELHELYPDRWKRGHGSSILVTTATYSQQIRADINRLHLSASWKHFSLHPITLQSTTSPTDRPT